MLQLLKINVVANRIHEWSESGQNLWKQIALARICSIALAAIEATSMLYYSAFLLTWQLPVNVINKSIYVCGSILSRIKRLENIQCQAPNLVPIKKNMFSIAKIIVGLASTSFFGIIFSPEINFWLHCKLGLTVDNVGLRKEKAMKVKLEVEAKAAIIRKERAERFTQFQNERQATKAAEDQDDNNIDADLAKLFAYL